MCRSIRPLNNFEPPATPEEIQDAARQYVRKITGTQRPSQANQVAFDEAVAAVAEASQRVLSALTSTAPQKNREQEAAKARSRNTHRFTSA